jgi:head-tail adaptor
MNVGELNKRVTIYRITGTADGFGGTTKNKTTLKTIWAKLVYKGGEVDVEAGLRMQTTGIELIVRELAVTDLLFTDTLSIGEDATEYNINSILETELDKYVTIKATKAE